MEETQDLTGKLRERSRQSGNAVVRFVRGAYRTMMTILTALAAGVFLVAAFSDHVSPHTFLYVSYLGIAFPILLALAAAWTLLLLLLRHWVLAFLMAGAMVAGHDAVSRTVPLHFGTTEAEASPSTPHRADGTLSVLTYNTCHLGQVRLSDSKADVPVIEVVRRSGADVVCLQEYGFSLSSAGHTEQQLRQSLTDLYPYYHYLPYHGARASGIALYSRYPIREVRRVDEREAYFASMCYLLNVDGRDLAVINNHLHTNAILPEDREFYGQMVEHFQSDSLERVHLNVIRKLGRGYLARASQSERVAAVCRSLGDDTPVIVCGDMNDTPVSYCCHTIRGSLADTWREAGRGLGVTYNHHNIRVRIDHLFHSRHLRPTSVRVLDEYSYSDHYPLLATYRWRNP